MRTVRDIDKVKTAPYENAFAAAEDARSMGVDPSELCGLGRRYCRKQCFGHRGGALGEWRPFDKTDKNRSSVTNAIDAFESSSPPGDPQLLNSLQWLKSLGCR